MPAYLTEDPNRAARNGEEATVEYILLRRCNYLVHNYSSIPRAVLLTVPDMLETNIDFDEPSSPRQTGPKSVHDTIKGLVKRIGLWFV